MTTAVGTTTRVDATDRPRLTGWTITAASLLMVAGGFNLVNGYTLLEHKSYLSSRNVIYDNLSFWGWAFVIWGILQLVAGALVFARRNAGTYLGVTVASIACFLWFFMLFLAPFGMLVGITVNSLVLIGLTAGRADLWEENY